MYLLTLFLLCVCGDESSSSESLDFAVGVTGEQIASWVKAFESTGFRGAVLAAKDDQVVAAVGVGYADLENKNHNTPSTLFELASITKPITAIGVLRLVGQNKLALDDSIAKHLPDIPENCRGITVRHLLQHTSGIPGANFEGDGSDLKKAMKSYLRGGPRQTPGKKFEYWNQGYALLSEIIGRASGTDYVAFSKHEIFGPAGMKSTCFTGDVEPDGSSVSVGRSIFEAPRSALEHPYGAYDLRYRGMGGVVSNVWDLWRLNVAINEHTLLNKDTAKEMFTAGPGNYALGWYALTNRQGRKVQMHSGSVRGFHGIIIRFPESKSFIAVLCNGEDSDAFGMATDIENMLFGKKPNREKPPKPVPQKLSEAMVGDYRSDDGRKCKIELDGPVTRMLIEWSPPNGPATRATLGTDDQGGLLLYDPRGNSTLKTHAAEADESIVAVSLDKLIFKRVTQ